MPRRNGTSKPRSRKGAVDSEGKAAAVASSTRAGRKAVAVEQGLKATNIVRLRRAEGQVRGIVRMVEQDRYCADTIIQIAAAQESLRAVAKNLLKNHLRHCAAAAMHKDATKRDDIIEELLVLVGRVGR